jgi:hypothetical protein
MSLLSAAYLRTVTEVLGKEASVTGSSYMPGSACFSAPSCAGVERLAGDETQDEEEDSENEADAEIVLHEVTLDRVLRQLQAIFPRLVRKALKLVSETQANYWMQEDPVFFSLCCSGDVETSLRRFEQQCGMASD